MGKLTFFYCNAQEWEGDRSIYLSFSISEQNVAQKKAEDPWKQRELINKEGGKHLRRVKDKRRYFKLLENKLALLAGERS